MRSFFVLNILFFIAVNLFGQTNKEIGFPLIKNYSPKQYGSAGQNWAIIQGKTGIMCFGNSGVLQYDGFDWRITSLPNNSTVRSFAIDENGRIYVGAVGDFGYLQADSIGNIRFISLLKFVPEQYKEFADVWNSYVDGDDVFFTTDSHVYRWSSKSKKIKVWKPSNSFHVSFLVNGIFYIREWGKGLLRLDADSLKLIPASRQFADERIYVMLPMRDNPSNILVVTRTKGMFLFDGVKFTPFKTEADEFIKENLIYLQGLVLNDGNIALGTITGGLIIINPNGKILNIYDTNSGLSSNTIYYVYQDNAGSIWIGQENGISKIDYRSSASYFDNRNGITETPYDMERFKGAVYLTTNSGIYYLDTEASLFQPVKNSPVTQVFALTVFNDHLVAGSNEGLFEIKNGKAFPIRKSVNKDFEIAFLLSSEYNKNRLYIGTTGVSSFLMKNNEWIDEGTVLETSGFVTNIVETKAGDLFLGNTVKGIHKVKFKKDNNGQIIISNSEIEFFDEKNGLPSGGSSVFNVLGKYFFSTSEGIYRFDESKKRFFRDDSTFSFVNVKSYNEIPFFAFEDSLKRVWASGGAEPVLGVLKNDGTYDWIIAPFKRFSDENIINIYPDKNNIVWFFTYDGLIKYNLELNANKFTEYSALISEVSIGADSAIYYGNLEKQRFIPEISFEYNSIKFRYSAASYEDEAANKFRLYLDGFDRKWSSWNSQHIKEYTNLSPGKYTFKVMAKNTSNLESNEAGFSFIIIPPWYRTWWAYASYVLCFGLLFFAANRYQKRRLILKEREHSRLLETELRAEAAEAKTKVLQTENERKKNVELLSEIGKEITASLDLDIIFNKLYDNVNQLADATIFGVGIYHPEKEEIEYKLAIEKGKRYPVYSRDMKDKNQFPVWCILNHKPVFINDVSVEYKNYIDYYKEPEKYLEDGTKSEEPKSLIYLPLISQERLLGIITIQSFKKNSYTDYHLNILRNLATYTSIAIDNADAYRQLNETVTKLDNAINDLKATQEKLIVQQKLASLGQLTAGIAHEIKNPLNFVNNFAEVSVELVGELKDEISKLKNKVPDYSSEDMLSIIKDLEENSNRINQHGKRADSIVKSMLQHSRGKAGERQESDINAILEEDINLAYHGMRARDSSFNITIEKEFDENLSKISVVPQDVSRVFLNIIQNGFYETNKKKIQNGNSYLPKILIQTKNEDEYVKVKIRDNGNGIPLDAQDKLFEPFFTTKPSGEGTGLGLSLSFDIIVKQHGGDIKFETELGKFTEFIITMPKDGN